MPIKTPEKSTQPGYPIEERKPNNPVYMISTRASKQHNFHRKDIGEEAFQAMVIEEKTSSQNGI